jgi:hypothetical protein
MEDKIIKIEDFLSPAQVMDCILLYKKLGQSGELHSAILDHIITPNIANINKKLGQENDPRYLAYAIEFALMKAETRDAL